MEVPMKELWRHYERCWVTECRRQDVASVVTHWSIMFYRCQVLCGWSVSEQRDMPGGQLDHSRIYMHLSYRPHWKTLRNWSVRSTFCRLSFPLSVRLSSVCLSTITPHLQKTTKTASLRLSYPGLVL